MFQGVFRCQGFMFRVEGTQSFGAYGLNLRCGDSGVRNGALKGLYLGLL